MSKQCKSLLVLQKVKAVSNYYQLNRVYMREIKFRAEYEGKVYKVAELRFTDQGIQVTLIGASFFSLHIDNINLIQFTGLLDKNGKEIYEGDIVKFNTFGGNEMIYEVRWSDAKTGFKPTRLTKTNQDEIQIIGNIYENPELAPLPKE